MNPALCPCTACYPLDLGVGKAVQYPNERACVQEERRRGRREKHVCLHPPTQRCEKNNVNCCPIDVIHIIICRFPSTQRMQRRVVASICRPSDDAKKVSQQQCYSERL